MHPSDAYQPPPDTPSLAGFRILGGSDNYTPTSSGGAEKAAHELYSRWGEYGADVTVVSVPHGDPYRDPNVTVSVAKGHDLSSLVGGYLGVSPQTFRLVAKHAKQLRPHVLHANTIHYNSSVALARMARRSGTPFVLTAQVGSIDAMPFLTRTAAAAYERTVGRYIVRRATRILAVSNAVRDHMLALGATDDQVSVVENGVDHDRFAMAAPGASDDPLILSVGRIVDNKGPQLLVDAAIALARQGRTFRIGFLGDGPLRTKLERTVADAGLTDRIQFHGQVREVERWLEKASIVIRPSFTEGLPLAVLEAMSAGRCNIVSDIAPNKELIVDGVNGLTFATGNADDLARKLATVLDDQDLCLRLAAAGQVSSRARSWDRMAIESAAVLAEVAGFGATVANAAP